MKRFKLSAVFAFSLMLTQHALCADARLAKNPPNSAQKAKCEAQLAEINQQARVFNAKVDEIQALAAEIDRRNAELDKEKAAVDRRDSAAMQALNAMIVKNNALVEKHTQMGAVLDAMASENKQRVAQFQETCENRPLAQANL
ncbi:hypothetical protein [Massilia sp. CF038]|uniref:hypothetical protein n=1 Tax=Massilia sp. CF038 TaxID=1881045 RepID=UPI000911CE33|nr:hypothetical protein [Massilia sp. CF038]SHH14456.1 hypothetical protein SAMN05428948_3008 [Massilia sp. CF038]